MIRIRKSETADTRTCDFRNVSKETLRQSSAQHIGDVAELDALANNAPNAAAPTPEAE